MVKKQQDLEWILLLVIFSMAILIIGSSFNFVAISNNHGKMPVKLSLSYETDTHFSYQENLEVEYWYFTDIIDLKYYIISIGDVLMVLGGTGVMVLLIRYVFYKTKHLNSSSD